MAQNPYVNKVQIADGTVLMDISGDTVNAGNMLDGVTAHKADGAPVTGSIPGRDADDLTASDGVVSVPAGYYPSAVSKGVGSGSTTQNAPTVNSSGLVTATSTVTAGYQSAGTKSNTLQLSNQGATTVTPTRSAQTAVSAGKYTTGAVTVAAIPSSYYTLAEVYPVGSLYATESSTANPSTILGFGTWSKLAPAALTWDEIYDMTWNNVTGVTSGVYVWKRTA